MKYGNLLACALFLQSALAIDVESSRPRPAGSDTTPGVGKKFSIFSGDPERIKRANEVDLKLVESKLEISPSPFSFVTAANATARPELSFSLNVKNLGKRAFTLSYPTTQRFNLIIKNASGLLVYDYTADKEFLQMIGTVMVNPADRITYREKLTEEDLGRPLSAGTYTAEMTVANYPELKASATFIVQ